MSSDKIAKVKGKIGKYRAKLQHYEGYFAMLQAKNLKKHYNTTQDITELCGYIDQKAIADAHSEFYQEEEEKMDKEAAAFVRRDMAIRFKAMAKASETAPEKESAFEEESDEDQADIDYQFDRKTVKKWVNGFFETVQLYTKDGCKCPNVHPKKGPSPSCYCIVPSETLYLRNPHLRPIEEPLEEPLKEDN
jgi:hypothetical protein